MRWTKCRVMKDGHPIEVDALKIEDSDRKRGSMLRMVSKYTDRDWAWILDDTTFDLSHLHFLPGEFDRTK